MPGPTAEGHPCSGNPLRRDATVAMAPFWGTKLSCPSNQLHHPREVDLVSLVAATLCYTLYICLAVAPLQVPSQIPMGHMIRNGQVYQR